MPESSDQMVTGESANPLDSISESHVKSKEPVASPTVESSLQMVL